MSQIAPPLTCGLVWEDKSLGENALPVAEKTPVSSLHLPHTVFQLCKDPLIQQSPWKGWLPPKEVCKYDMKLPGIDPNNLKEVAKDQSISRGTPAAGTHSR